MLTAKAIAKKSLRHVKHHKSKNDNSKYRYFSFKLFKTEILVRNENRIYINNLYE